MSKVADVLLDTPLLPILSDVGPMETAGVGDRIPEIINFMSGLKEPSDNFRLVGIAPA